MKLQFIYSNPLKIILVFVKYLKMNFSIVAEINFPTFYDWNLNLTLYVEKFDCDPIV